MGREKRSENERRKQNVKHEGKRAGGRKGHDGRVNGRVNPRRRMRGEDTKRKIKEEKVREFGLILATSWSYAGERQEGKEL